jgi:predicted transposase YdaD
MREEGAIRAKQDGILKVLQARFITVSEELRERIKAIATSEELDRLLVRAATAESLDDVRAALRT